MKSLYLDMPARARRHENSLRLVAPAMRFLTERQGTEFKSQFKAFMCGVLFILPTFAAVLWAAILP